MNTRESFWIFGHLGLSDHIVCNALYRHFASLHSDKFVIIPICEHNLAGIQWMLSDVPNTFFYPIETEQQLLTCKASIHHLNKLCLGFYEELLPMEKVSADPNDLNYKTIIFNPLLWDSEFYRQAGLDPELKWQGFKLSELKCFEYVDKDTPKLPEHLTIVHEDKERGFLIRDMPDNPHLMHRGMTLRQSACSIYNANEIHCIDSSMLNLADLMETPYCKRFVFHKYARKGLPPRLRKDWEVIE